MGGKFATRRAGRAIDALEWKCKLLAGPSGAVARFAKPWAWSCTAPWVLSARPGERIRSL